MRKSNKRISFDDHMKIIHDEVFEHQDFNRHIKEVAEKLSVPEDVVEVVVKQYITSFVGEMNKVKRVIRRLIVPAWLHIDIVEPKFYKFNNIKSKRHESKSKCFNRTSKS